MRKKKKKYWDIYKNSKKILIVLVWLFFSKTLSWEFFPTSFIKQTNNKKRNYAFKHEPVLHRVISVQPRNLVKKRNLARFGGILWPLHAAASESQVCVPRCDTRPPRRSPNPAAAGQGSAAFLTNSTLCVPWQESKTALSTCRNLSGCSSENQRCLN